MYGGLTNNKEGLATDRFKVWIVKGASSVHKRGKYFLSNGNKAVVTGIKAVASSLPTKARVSHATNFRSRVGGVPNRDPKRWPCPHR